MDYGGFRIISADPEDPSAGKQNKAWPVCALQPAIMDFNVKKLASDAGVFFTRAVQVRWPACVRACLPPWGLMCRRCIRRWQQLRASLLSASRRRSGAFQLRNGRFPTPTREHPANVGAGDH